MSTAKLQYFVTNNDVDTVKNSVTPKTSSGVYFVENKEPIYDTVDRTTKFTNGPHGAEYQLSSRTPHSPFTVSNGRDNSFNFLLNPIKQSRKDTDAPISLITPLTHLTISGSFNSKNNVTTTPIDTMQPTQFVNDPSTDKQSSTPIYSDSLHEFDSSPQVNNRQNTIQAERESSRPNQQRPSGFFTVTTPKNEPSRGIITHMNAISQTRFQSSRVTPSLTSVAPNDEEKSNDLIFNQPANYFTQEVHQNIRPDLPQTTRPDVTQTTRPDVAQTTRSDVTQTTRPELVISTESPFLYTRSRTTSSNIENIPYQGHSNPGSTSPDLITKTPSDELTIYSEFGQKIKPGTNPATTSFTAYYPGSTSQPVSGNGWNNGITSTEQRKSNNPVPYENSPYQPKFVLRPTGSAAVNSNRQPLSSFNGYSDDENRNANFYPDLNQQKPIEFSDKNHNNIQPESKYVNTKKEFVPQYNPSSTPIPGLLGVGCEILLY